MANTAAISEPATAAPAPAPGRLGVMGPNGYTTIDEADAPAAYAQGLRPATEAEYFGAKKGIAGEIASGVVGAARGATFGLSDKLYVEGAGLLGGADSAEEVRHRLSLLKEANPNASLAGELGGAVAPMLFGGGAGAAAELGEGGAWARAGARALQAAPRAAAEGAAIGLGQQYSEDTLQNHTLTAEHYLTAGVKGGTIGLLLGAGTAAGVGAVGDRFFGRGLARATEAGAEAEGQTAYRTAGKAEAYPAEEAARPRGVISINPDAGLAGGSEAIEKPFAIGKQKYAIGLDDKALYGEFASAPKAVGPIAKEPVLFRGGFAEPAGAPVIEETEPFFKIGKAPRIREDDYMFGEEAGAPVFPKKLDASGGIETERAPIGVQSYLEDRFGVRPTLDAGLGEEVGERSALFRSKGRSAPADVRFAPGAETAEARAPIGIRVDKDILKAEAEARAAARRGAAPNLLEKEAGKRHFQGATGAKTGDLRRLAADAEGVEGRQVELGQMLAREKTSEGLPLTGPWVTQGESAKRIAARMEEVGKEIGPLYKTLDAAAARPETSKIAMRFADEVAGPRLAMPLGEHEVAPAQAYLKAMLEKGGENPDFSTLWGYRKQLDGMLKGEYAKLPTAPAKVGAEDLRALRGLVDDELMSAADRASTELGTGIGDKLRLTNALYGDLATVNKIATHQASLHAAAPAFTLTDVIAGTHGGPAGMAMMGANMVRRKFGDQITAHVLDKVNRLQAVKNAQSHVDDLLNKGTKAFVSGTASSRPVKTLTAAEVRAVRDAASDTAVVQSRTADAIGDLPKYAPKVAAAMATTAARTAVWLSRSLPKEQPPTGPVFTGRPQQPMSDTDLRRASQIIETVEDPTIVVDRLRQGQLTATHVQTLKICSPETFLKIQGYIRDHAADLRPTMTVQQQCNLSLLFETPITEAMKPANVKALQASFVQGNQAPTQGSQGAPPGMSAGPMKGGGSRATQWDKQEIGT